MRGRNDSAFLNYFNSQLPKYAGYGKTYHGAYGFRWRRQFQFDQLERAYKALKANPSTRQVVLQIWDPRIDLPNVKGKPAAPDVPCNIVSLLKIRNNCLEWTQIMRSNDVFRGFPHNVVQFTAVQEVLAGWLGLQVGSYNHFSDSLHVYQDKESDDLPAIRQSLPCSIPLNNDDLSLPKATSDKMFLELERCVDRIIKTKTTCSDIQLLVKTAKLSEAYKNILIVLCSEALRRRKKSDFAKEMITQCSNKALRHMFERWMAHLQRRAQEMA
ncbi:MAG: thyA [Verrucomicrobiales bacterium]|nr:thyA [Verrucomicrobiales bacterium]